jgi:hypothetical protein
MTYPIRFTYRRLCNTCKTETDCRTTVFNPGRVLYQGDCGHFWDINGNLLDITKWLDNDRKFPLAGTQDRVLDSPDDRRASGSPR